MHERGIVHGDVCANNVLCSDEGAVKLVNLSTAISIADVPGYQAARRVHANWQAPEVIEGSAYRREVDIWALGCFAYELATGRPPFAKMANWTKLLDHISKKEVPSIPGRWSTSFQDFIDKCLEKKPEERYTAE